MKYNYSLLIEKISEHKTMNIYILGRGSFCGQELLFVQGVHLLGVSDQVFLWLLVCEISQISLHSNRLAL